MAILSNSWAQHLAGIAGNDDANKNMRAFTEALALSKTTTEQQNTLVEEVDVTVLLMVSKKLVQQTHSWTKFRGTQSRPKITIAASLGLAREQCQSPLTKTMPLPCKPLPSLPQRRSPVANLWMISSNSPSLQLRQMRKPSQR